MTASPIGRRYLVRYYEADEQGRADLLPQLDKCLARGQIDQAEYDRAIAGEPPDGYVAPMTAAAEPGAPTSSDPES